MIIENSEQNYTVNLNYHILICLHGKSVGILLETTFTFRNFPTFDMIQNNINTLQQLDTFFYSLSITFSSVVIQGDKILVNLMILIVPKCNSILATQFLEIGLFPNSSSEEAQSIAEPQVLHTQPRSLPLQ